jgi:ABC-type multidrug transport system ATPase subunit
MRIDNSVITEEQNVRELTGDRVISTLHLKKAYNKNELVIKDVSFMVKKKEILGLLGPNSAGKSTIFSILTSLIPKSDGFVKL